MEITQQLYILACTLEATGRSTDAALCRRAAGVINGQYPTGDDVRFDRFFAAIMTGLVARRSMTDIERRKLWEQAGRLARSCCSQDEKSAPRSGEGDS